MVLPRFAPFWRLQIIERSYEIINTLLFIQTILMFGWLTEHTGGLSQSIYGPGYLALFPVALIVPRENWIKLWAGLSVALVAFIMSWYAVNWRREVFVCVTSITGCLLGVGIRWFLIKLTKSETSN